MKKELKQPQDLQAHLGFWLRFVSNHVSQAFARKVEARGVTVAEWVVLRVMYQRDATAPSELAELTGLTRGAVSKLADRLIAKKLFSRKYATIDRRYQSLKLTDAGCRLVPVLAALADANDAQFFHALTAGERAALKTILQKLVHAHDLVTVPIE